MRASLMAAGLSLLACHGAQAAEQRFDCVIDPARIIKIASPVIGLLAEVSVDRGDEVKKGQVIARLESDVEELNVKLQRAQAEATDEIDAQKERVALSKKTYERAARLANNAVTRQRLDELQSDLTINQRELATARLGQHLAKLQVQRAEAQLEQRRIRSPEDGVIIERVLSAGEFVDTNSYVVRLAKLDPLFVETFLPVALYKKVHVGMSAVVEPREPIGGRHAAKVAIIDQVFDSASGTFGVRLELPNPDKKLPAGLRCQVVFDLE